MGKRKNLNGLPNNLVQSYFSTLKYYDRGYMPCWIWKRATELGIHELEIDILSKTTIPKAMKTKPITTHLDELKKMIVETLTENQFSINYIVDAKFKIWLSKQDIALNQITCQCILEDINGRKYIGKVYKERAYPIADSMFEKIIKLIKQM